MSFGIKKDFYCSADSYSGDNICGIAFLDTENDGDTYCHRICKNYHQKWPTPEQFRMEYHEYLSDDFPVWFIIPEDNNGNFPDWTLMIYADALQYQREEEEADFLPEMHIVCACTPFGKPDKDWRPA